MLSGQPTADENALHGFRHIEPGTTQGGIQRHNAVRKQPDDHRRGMMASQIIPNQQHA